MTRLLISKPTEAKAVAMIQEMAGESLDPESYESLSNILKQMCETRSIGNKLVGIELQLLSGHRDHGSDCATNSAPAYLPTPCDCNYFEEVPEIVGFEGTRDALSEGSR